MVAGPMKVRPAYVAPINWIPKPVWIGVAAGAAFVACKAVDHFTSGKPGKGQPQVPNDDPPATSTPWPSTASAVKPEHVLGKTVAELSAQLIRYDDRDGDNRVSLAGELPANIRQDWMRGADQYGNDNGYASTAELTSFISEAPIHRGSPLPETFGYSHARTIIETFLPEAE
jgi:hypothetical protein